MFKVFSLEKLTFISAKFLSNFFKYSFLNFPSSYTYNIFTVYFSNNFLLLKFLSSAISNFSCYLTSIFNLLSNSATIFFTFSNSSSFSHESYSTVSLFYHTKYFTTSLTFLLFDIFLTFYSSTSSLSTGFTSSTFCSSTCSLYHTA